MSAAAPKEDSQVARLGHGGPPDSSHGTTFNDCWSSSLFGA